VKAQLKLFLNNYGLIPIARDLMESCFEESRRAERGGDYEGASRRDLEGLALQGLLLELEDVEETHKPPPPAPGDKELSEYE
jgi:hypothetical protein